MNRRQLFASTLVLLWLLVAGGYLYSLEAARWRPFIRSDPARGDLAQFDGAALRGVTTGWQTPGHIAIVHFYDARCACSAASLEHIEDL
ncbi:MAG TPA: hypothetical protein VLC91_06150, partial [Spongiibacteraceae bacterium]|nr:hypothetical protein [Spongiibacteraceae bacterium]